MRLGDQVLELGVGAEVRVDPGEVGDPVAVVARGRVGAGALHRLVDERRRQPDRVGAEALDVAQLLGQAGDVAAVVEALVARVEAVVEPAAGDAAGVVGLVAVGETVRHHEVEAPVAAGLAQRGGGHRLVGRGRLRGRLVGRRHRDRVARGVVGEDQRRGVLEVERDVGRAGGAAAPALGPAAVDRDLVVVVAGRDREGVLPGGAAGHGVEPGAGAGGRPVVGAAELGLQRADEGDAGGRRGVRGERRGGRRDRERGGDQRAGEQGGDGRRGPREARHGSSFTAARRPSERDVTALTQPHGSDRSQYARQVLQDLAGRRPPSVPRCSHRRALPALPVRRAQVALEDLAGGVARQRLEHVDAARALEVREPLAAPGDQLLLGRRRCRAAARRRP